MNTQSFTGPNLEHASNSELVGDTMAEKEAFAFVCASAAALGLGLGDAQALRVTAHFRRTSALATLLAAVPLKPDAEPAQLYCPQPYQDVSALASAEKSRGLR